jgi:serine/threonine protein kinase
MAVTGPDWAALNRLLDAALLLPPAERGSWVESLQGDDARLRPMLLELLRKKAPELPTLPPLGEGGVRPQAADDETRAPAGARVGDVLLGRFKLTKIIGRGGMGLVFAANDLQMQGEPQVAIKLLNEAMRANPIADIALQRECRKVRMLANDAIVRVFEFYRSGDQAFITMELLEGTSLDKVLGKHPDGMSFDETWRIIRPVADALCYAHRQSPPFVHSDLKPPNVFLTNSGRVKVLDFGVARAVRTADGTVTGLTLFDPAKYGALTPAYASCEMLAGLSADPSDDVYALACVTYELLSGRHPFARTPADKARARQLTPQAISRLSPRQNAALAHGLALERSERTPSVEQFVTELEHAGRPAEARVRRTAVVGAAACAAALLVALGSYWLWARKAPPAATTPRGLIAGDRALALLQTLGVTAPQVKPDGRYSPTDIGRIIEGSPRHVTLGSTREQIDAALALCRRYSSSCEPSWYEDESLRQAVLTPFALEAAPVTVREFRDFVAATHYQTEAERSGVAYAVVDGNLQAVAGGSWRNAVNRTSVADAAAVVGVSFADATEYCRSRGLRLPTEDEWEYATRGPERHTFGWGEDSAPANIAYDAPPPAASGPAEGIDARYRGLSANVWQWVDTEVAGRKVLKGGSWLETNPANKRAATRRYESPGRADADSGFRCARSLAAWPDAPLWLAQLR